MFCATDSVGLRRVALYVPDGHRNRADQSGGITSDCFAGAWRSEVGESQVMSILGGDGNLPTQLSRHRCSMTAWIP